MSVAPRQRGAWIETFGARPVNSRLAASPLGNGGRGLKHVAALVIVSHPLRRPSATGGVD